MIAWTAIQEALQAWASAQTGLEAVWMNAPQGWVGKAYVVLSVTSVNAVGRDEVRYEEDADAEAGAEQVPTFAGVRQFVCSLRVVSRDQSFDAQAIHYMEVLRSSLARASVRSAFNTAGFCVADILASLVADRKEMDRWESVALMDIRCNTVANVTDRDEATGQIETVQISSDLLGATENVNNLDEELFGNT